MNTPTSKKKLQGIVAGVVVLIVIVIILLCWLRGGAQDATKFTLEPYTNTDFNYTFSRPSDFVIVGALTPAQKEAAITYMGTCHQTDETGVVRFCYVGPKIHETFAAAAITVKAELPTSAAKCQVGEKWIINGADFYMSTSTDAALGHYVSSESYTSYYNKSCYQIDLAVESHATEKSDPAFYAQSRTTLDMMMQSMRQSMGTFKLLK